MEKDIVDGKIGAVGAYDVEFKEGKLVAKLDVEKVGVGASVAVFIKAEAVLEAIKKAIPGQIDDAVLNILEGVLKA